MTARSSIPREQGRRAKQKCIPQSWLAWEVTFHFRHTLLACSGSKQGDIDSFLHTEWQVSNTAREVGDISEAVFGRYNLWHALWWNLSLLFTNSQNYFWKTTENSPCVFKNKLGISTSYIQLYFSALVSNPCFWVQLCLLDDGRCCYSHCTLSPEKPNAYVKLYRRGMAASGLSF